MALRKRYRGGVVYDKCPCCENTDYINGAKCNRCSYIYDDENITPNGEPICTPEMKSLREGNIRQKRGWFGM